MQLVLTGKNFVVSDRIREYVEKKVVKLDRYLPSIDEARVEISQEKTKSAKDRNVVQLTLRTNGAIRFTGRLCATKVNELIAGKVNLAINKT
jgi:ribosomal subunit interface protein